MTPENSFVWKDLGLGPVRSLDDRIRAREELPHGEAEFITNDSARIRYNFLLQAISKKQEIWTIWSDDNIVEYGESPTWIPVLPNQQCCVLASKHESGVSCVPIPVDDFVDEIIPFLSRYDINISMFPSPTQRDVILLDWRDFLVDLSGAWEQTYEIEALASPTFQEFAYLVIQRRIASQNS